MGEDPAHRFEAVYRQTYRPILGFVLRRCGSAEDAADIVAETFVTAWRRIDDLPEGDDARLWLYGVARRVIANHKRGQQRHQKKTAVLSAELAVQPAVAHADTYRTSPAVEVFQTLPEGDREVLALMAWEGLDHGEIAKVLDCSRNAVAIRLHRARRRFARALDAAGITDFQGADSIRPEAEGSRC
ncbi:RNA polymerase sigma factor [Actinomadura rudentiformis]|uniref:RNA polymerase sigma factor n=1 Tax=Actinomadura rudentiformis TaxID=359158 RepID=A0A6H9YZE6_9ACTN|nr:RNA polymerase sigma factor [Actinomadura rudentiformis]KAB2349654.1 RNA polymerase sigma factor [Actinomadura rudentiformis]